MKGRALTHEELIIKIRQYFETATERAWDDKAQNCRFRTSDGRKCVVGSLIPDELYDERIEVDPDPRKDDSSAEVLKEVLTKAGVPDDNRTETFLVDCQNLHDNPASWKKYGFDRFDRLDEIVEKFEKDLKECRDTSILH